ncbi:hypothetical protein [Planotetraspora kaengkrachanensis]|uniref:Uncharacterized protein n=1 Tax=Planotetraspora kaengkrachanensis TaxID=575193 RepID=A0A8J3PV29_9ACTN|nr:hypothetical protein [Planotetraspora kaengkrachanensis]GIG81594.1 hypothetical protein Pka01_47210 [Planotetraspora kaengkrachanensis]
MEACLIESMRMTLGTVGACGHRPAELFTGVEPTPLSLGLEVAGEWMRKMAATA